MSERVVNQYDRMTKTPLTKLLVQLSVPTIISMLVTNVYNMADTAFVGTLGNSASGAVGVVFGFMSILQAIGFMFGMGSGTIVSRSLGKKDVKSASIIASTGFFCAIFCGIVLEVIGFITIDGLVDIFGSTPTIAPYAKTYISFILFAAPVMVPCFVMNNLLRYEGKATLGMIGLMAGAIINILGDALFIFIFDMGIAGAGLSTALSQLISFIILFSMFVTGKTQCKLSIKNVRFEIPTVGNICGSGLPSLLRQALFSIVTMVLNYEAKMYGDVAVAAMSIVSRISMFVFSFALGIGQGFQPISGFNYGAKKYNRVRKAFVITAIFAETLIVIMSLTVIIFASNIVTLFRDDPEVISIAVRALRLQCASQFIVPICMVTEMLFQSTGHKLGASILSSLRSGLFFIPILIILANVRGLSGIQEAQPLANLVSAVPAMFFLVWFFKHMPREEIEDK